MGSMSNTRGCPVAAVTLGLNRSANAPLLAHCGEVFTQWRNVIEEGLSELPAAQRNAYADTVLATFEGALILCRARQSADPMRNAGRWLDETALQSA